MPGQAAFPCRARAGPWAELKAQARARVRAVPGTGTGPCGPGRAWAVLYRAVPVSAQRAWPIWKTLHQSENLLVDITNSWFLTAALITLFIF